MTTYYVSKEGSDSNNGLGPDASHASNKPFLTIGKLIATSGVMVAGDTAYIGPGVYREAITANITSPGSETFILGDPQNAQGFKTSGGVLVTPGYVHWTAYTTNDTTLPGAQPLNLNGRDFLTFRDILFVGGSSATIVATTTTSQSIQFTRCVFLPGSTVAGRQIAMTTAADTAFTWTIDSCIFIGGVTGGCGIQLTAPAGSSADYNLAVTIKNCLFLNSQNTIVQLTGAASNKPGGITILNCTFMGDLAFRVATGGSTSIPCTINNCYIMSGNTGLQATATGEIIEDYNIILASTPRTNVSTGTHSISDGSRANLFEVGQAALWGFTPRLFMTPMAGSPILGFGDNGSAPSTDFLNRPRPAGGASTSKAAGATERHDTAVQETSVTQAGSNSVKITGPGDHDFQIPVDATSTSLSIYVRYDTNHGTGSKPQVILLANGAIGVATETKTATVGVDTWEQLSFSSFTPTAKGAVTVRCVSRAAAGNGLAYFDTAAGGASSTSGFDYFRQGEPLSTIVAGGSGGGLKVHPGMQGGANG